MFEVLTGSFQSLENAFLADLPAQRKKDPLSSLLVLSPSGRLLTHLQTKLAQQKSGFLNIQFLTFYALAERLISESSYTEPVITEPALYHEMIRQVLSGENPEPVDVAIRQAFQTEGKTISRGLAGALAATMKDMRDAGMRADKALQSANEGFLGEEAPEAAATLALYGRLIGLFEKHNLRSSADLLRRAAGEAPKNVWLKQQKAIFLYGFYDLTGVQLDLVLSLANHPNARVYFPYKKENPAYKYAEKLLNDSAFVSKLGTVPKSNHIRDLGPSPNTEIYSCSGSRDEVWLAAKEILNLLDEGVPYREIAVIARDLSAYLPAIREIFRTHEIPYAASRNEPAGSHPLVKTIRTLVSFDEKHPSAKTLREDLGKSVYLRLTPGYAAPLPVGEGNNAKKSLSSKERDGAAQGEAKLWPSHISWASTLIHQCIRLPKDASPEEQSLLSAVLSSLDELSVLDHLGMEVTRQHFLDTWLEKLDHLERPGPARAHDGIQVLEVQQARGLSFKTVFLLGMNEKVFPRLIREDPFLSDAARSALAQATGCRLGRKLDGYEEERFLFELMRQAATQKLYLFTQRSDDEGKARIPSVYLKELESAVPGTKPHRLPRSTVEKFDKRVPNTWTPKEISFLMNRAGLEPEPAYKALGWDVAGYHRHLAAHQAIETFKKGLGAYDGVLSDPALVKKTLEAGFSPTSLEDLAECPFQYFAGHVLRIPVEEVLAPEGEMTPQALGQLFHKTLEIFYTGCAKPSSPTATGGGSMGSPPETAGNDVSKALREAADACFKEFAASLSTVYPLALKISKELVIKELFAFLKSDLEECAASGFTPRWFEQNISGTMTAGGTSYPFHGKPDRLDLKEEAGTTQVRVVDYKSGKPRPWTGRLETRIIQGRLLQLPIYLALAGTFAEKELGKKVVAASAALRPVRDTEGEPTPPLTRLFWDSPSANLFLENMKELIGVIEKERFYIEPDTSSWGYCARCDFARICRKEHMPTRLRAERDPLRQRVVEKLARVAPKS